MVKWIDVNKKLPFIARDVIVYIYGEVALGYYYNDKWYINDESADWQPSHWMDLPKRPIDEQKDLWDYHEHGQEVL